MSDTDAPPASGFLPLGLAIVAIMLLVPMTLLLRLLLDRYADAGLLLATVTPANLARLAADPFLRRIVRNAAALAVLVTPFCLVLGLPVAYRLARIGRHWRFACLLALLLPLLAAAFLRIAFWLILFAHGGMPSAAPVLFGRSAIELLLTPVAMLAGALATALPCVILILHATLETIDPRLEDVAQSLGAAPGRAFRRVVWPLARWGLLRAGAVSFVLSVDAYATPYLLGGPAFRAMAPLLQDWPPASRLVAPSGPLLALLLMAATLALMTLGRRAR